jgi:hypothetical protein
LGKDGQRLEDVHYLGFALGREGLEICSSAPAKLAGQPIEPSLWKLLGNYAESKAAVQPVAVEATVQLARVGEVTLSVSYERILDPVNEWLKEREDKERRLAASNLQQRLVLDGRSFVKVTFDPGRGTMAIWREGAPTAWDEYPKPRLGEQARAVWWARFCRKKKDPSDRSATKYDYLCFAIGEEGFEVCTSAEGTVMGRRLTPCQWQEIDKFPGEKDVVRQVDKDFVLTLASGEEAKMTLYFRRVKNPLQDAKSKLSPHAEQAHVSKETGTTPESGTKLR